MSAEAAKAHPLVSDFIKLSATAKKSSDTLQATMYPNLLDVISQEFPLLAKGDETPEQFCQKLTDAAAKNA